MPCFYAHAGESVEAEGFKKEPEQIITAHIRKFYRTRERRPVDALHREIAADCAKSRLGIPSYGSVLRRLQAFDPRTLGSKRDGPRRSREQAIAPNLLSGLRSTGFRKKRSTH